MENPNVEQLQREIAILSEIASDSLEAMKAFTTYKMANKRISEHKRTLAHEFQIFTE